MIKNVTTVSVEDLRRTLGLPSHFSIKAVVMDGPEVTIHTESPLAAGESVKRIKGEDLTEVIRTINKALNSGKEIIFSYYNDKRDSIEITSRRFIPAKWVNDDCISGYDLEKREVRNFCPSHMEWIESVVIA